MTDREAIRRVDEFFLGTDRMCADRIEPVEGGFACLTPSLPLVWSWNYVMFEREGMEARRMAEICDEALSAAGLDHRILSAPTPEDGERLAADFEALGWEVESNALMVLRSEPDRPPEPGVDVRLESQPVALRRQLMEEDDFLRRQPRHRELVDQLIEFERRQNPAVGDRWFVAYADGSPASTARLLSRDGIGQVEDVATLASARNRGLARAAILAAAATSREEGDELTFIVADANDWPEKLYGRLGFETVGILRSFRLETSG